jgi:hypothetical protein
MRVARPPYFSIARPFLPRLGDPHQVGLFRRSDQEATTQMHAEMQVRKVIDRGLFELQKEAAIKEKPERGASLLFRSGTQDPGRGSGSPPGSRRFEKTS